MTPSTGLENLYKVLNNKTNPKGHVILHALRNYFTDETGRMLKVDSSNGSITISLHSNGFNNDLTEHLKSVINLSQYHMYVSYPENKIELVLVRR